jgi:hypothetical protein
MTDERRAKDRHTVWLPLELTAGEGSSLAVSRNVSEGGALILCDGPFEPGAQVTLNLSAALGSERDPIAGRVVRVDANTEDPHSIWPHMVAIEFTEPVPELERVIEGLRGKITMF